MANKAASVSSSASKVASSLASSASYTAASASAQAAGKSPILATTSLTEPLSIFLISSTVLIATLLGLHFSGNLDPLYKYIAKQYFKAEAKAELVAMQKTGSKEVENKMKEKLKENPVADMGDGELDGVAKGKLPALGKVGF